MNICMVGHGMMGVWHSESLLGFDCTLHTVVGRRPAPTDAFAAKYGYLHWTVDYAEALRSPEIDIVIVAGPSETHAEMAIMALNRGKHVLVEIPIAMTLADAETVVALADRTRLKLGVVHPMRFRREHVELLDRIAAGEERVRHVQSRMFTHRLENVGATGYVRSWTDNILWHHGAHLVDVGLWLLGGGNPAKAEEALRGFAAFVPPPDRQTGIPMDLAAMMATTGDQTMVCTASYYSPERIFDVFVVTDRNSYRLDILAGTMQAGSTRFQVATEQDNNAQVSRDFVDAVRQDRAPRVTGKDVLPAMRLLQRIEEHCRRL